MYPGLAALGTFLYTGLSALGNFMSPGQATLGPWYKKVPRAGSPGSKGPQIITSSHDAFG